MNEQERGVNELARGGCPTYCRPAQAIRRAIWEAGPKDPQRPQSAPQIGERAIALLALVTLCFQAGRVEGRQPDEPTGRPNILFILADDLGWPGHINPGTESHQPCLTFDFTSSMANLAGVAPDPSRPFDGIDIVKHVVEQKPVRLRTLFWRKPRGDTVWTGVRERDWKYVGQTKGQQSREYLFNLADDPAESEDLSQQQPQRLERLKAHYEQWEAEVRRHAPPHSGTSVRTRPTW